MLTVPRKLSKEPVTGLSLDYLVIATNVYRFPGMNLISYQFSQQAKCGSRGMSPFSSSEEERKYWHTHGFYGAALAMWEEAASLIGSRRNYLFFHDHQCINQYCP
jgi:hypothetical protein